MKIPIINSCAFVTKHFHNISLTIAFQLKKNELCCISTWTGVHIICIASNKRLPCDKYWKLVSIQK